MRQVFRSLVNTLSDALRYRGRSGSTRFRYLIKGWACCEGFLQADPNLLWRL